MIEKFLELVKEIFKSLKREREYMATNFTVDPSKQATFKQFNAVCHRYAALLHPEMDKTRYGLYRAFRTALAIHTKANGFLTMGDVQKALKADKVPPAIVKLLTEKPKASKAKAKPKAAKPKAKAAKPKLTVVDSRDAKIAKLQAQLDALQTLLNDM